MESLNNYITERIRIDNISSDTLPEELKEKYKLVYNPGTGRYDCNDDIDVKYDLIDDKGHFICNFGVVKGYFNCSNCEKLTSLKGTPTKVNSDFYCYNCPKLKTLEGAPKEVGLDFNCSNCEKLTSLEGAPKKVGGYFSCFACKNLETLKGAPEEVGGNFNCSNCPNLKDHNIKTKIGGEFKK